MKKYKVIKNTSYHGFKIGEIVKSSDEGRLRFNSLDDSVCYFLNKRDFELVGEEKEMFKVGDKVKVIKLMKDTERNTNLKIGDIGIVAEDNSKRPWITFKRGVRTDFDRGSNRWPLYEEEMQLINDKFTLSDVKERWLVVFRDGREGIAKKNSYGRIGFNVIKNGEVLCEYYDAYYNDLTHEINDKRDIVKVLKPKYEEVWERSIEKQVKKMTVKEIASVLGYDVEIVKE